MTNDNYITVPGWATRELGLSGHTLLVYSLIWTYHKTGNQCFLSKSNMASFLNITRQSVINIVGRLIAMGYIREVETNIGKPSVYDCVPLEEIEEGVKKFDSEKSLQVVSNDFTGGVKNLDSRCKKTLHNNKTIINNKKSIKKGNSTTPKKSAPRFIKPSLSEIRDFIFEKGYQVSAETFFNYYESNGWKVGRNPMKNWKAAVCHWQTKDRKGLTASSETKAPRADSAFATVAASAAEVYNSYFND